MLGSVWVIFLVATVAIGLVLLGLWRGVSRLRRKLAAHEHALRLSNRDPDTDGRGRRYLRVIRGIVGLAVVADGLRRLLPHPVAATAKVSAAAGVTALVLTGPCPLDDPAIPGAAPPPASVTEEPAGEPDAPPPTTRPTRAAPPPAGPPRPRAAGSPRTGARVEASPAPTMAPAVGVAVAVSLPVTVDSGARAEPVPEGDAPPRSVALLLTALLGST